MGLFVNTNTAAMKAQNQLRRQSEKLSKSFERLSSGLRINRASDDAAGLAISERFGTQIRGLSQATRNANDGISLVQTVEASLSEVSGILQRMRELSVQAANDINVDRDREAIQEEIDQLQTEIGRIAETTTFNNVNVLDGTFVEQSLHIGMNFREEIRISVDDARADLLGRAAVDTGVAVTSAALVAGGLVINGVSIRATQAPDDTVSTSLATGSAIAKAGAINDFTAHTGVTAIVNRTVREGDADIAGGTLDGSNYIRINDRIITGFTVIEGDADESLFRAINEESDLTGVEAFRDDLGRVELRAEDGRNIAVDAVGTGAAVTGLGAGVTHGSLSLHAEEQVFLRGAQEQAIGFDDNDLIGVTGVQAVDTVDVRTREGAQIGMLVIDRAIEQVTTQRAELGALQNRLTSTVDNLSAIIEGASAARARIRDADFARESSELTRNQILSSAATTILSQASQAPQQALQLLG